MKIKEGFKLREICGENVIVAHGEKNIDFSKVIHLNESAADMWKAIDGKEFAIADMVKALTDNYEVEAETAEKDASKVLNEWIELGIIEG